MCVYISLLGLYLKIYIKVTDYLLLTLSVLAVKFLETKSLTLQHSVCLGDSCIHSGERIKNCFRSLS
jgi:hypothetical protein